MLSESLMVPVPRRGRAVNKRKRKTVTAIIRTPHAPTIATSRIARLTMKNTFWTVENVYWVSQVLSFVLLAGTVVLGGIALFTGKLLNDRQSEAMLALSTKLADAREKQAGAELRLEAVRKHLAPRQLFGTKFGEVLQNKPRASAEILYQPDSPAALNFASEIYIELTQAKWDVSLPGAIMPYSSTKKLSDRSIETLLAIPPTLRVGGNTQSDVTIVVNNPSQLELIDDGLSDGPEMAFAPIQALQKAFSVAGINVGVGTDDGLPAEKVRIVVGPKM